MNKNEIEFRKLTAQNFSFLFSIYGQLEYFESFGLEKKNSKC